MGMRKINNSSEMDRNSKNRQINEAKQFSQAFLQELKIFLGDIPQTEAQCDSNHQYKYISAARVGDC